MKILMLSVILMLSSCSTIEQVKASKGIYCSAGYKAIRAVGRTALSVTTGLVSPDVCTEIDNIIAEEVTEEDKVGA